jgi:acetyl esterase/lipase
MLALREPSIRHKPRSELMPASTANTSQNPAPFVDQRPNGPGVSKIDPSDPAAPMYRLLAKMRSPVTLRDLMIHPVRTGYIGQEQPIAAADLPKSAAELYPEVGVSDVAVPSPAGRIRCQVCSPPASASGGGARPMMLYLHGGGFTVGQSEDTAYITSRIAAENAMVVVSANYRLAPEWPFPACMDDCLAVLQWMQKNGATLGGDGARIAMGGDSAGGNLAAALVIKARDEGVAAPQATVLLAPITDFFFEEHESFERLGPLGIVYDTAFIGYIRGAYLVHGKYWAHPHASPARADLRNYPPTFIATGTADPLVDDNRAFAQKLRAAGGKTVEHFIREGMPHGFYFFPGMFEQGDEAFAAIAAFLKRAGAA